MTTQFTIIADVRLRLSTRRYAGVSVTKAAVSQNTNKTDFTPVPLSPAKLTYWCAVTYSDLVTQQL